MSVVVPAYGVVATLRDAVESALSTSDVDVEVIIIDDASIDGSASIADELTRDPRVTVAHREVSGGPAVARNDGLARSRGEFVVFLDGDDVLFDGALGLLHDSMTGDTVAAMGRFVAVDDDGREIDIGTWAAEQLRPVVRRHGRFVTSPNCMCAEAILTRLVTPPPGAIMIRRDALERIGGYDVRARRSEDIDLLVRLASVGRLTMLSHDVLRYRRGSHQRSASTRRRQFGRQWTLVRLVLRAPSRAAAIERSRGAAAHHLDRAITRWNFGRRSWRDAVVALRSLALAGSFRVVGAVALLLVHN